MAFARKTHCKYGHELTEENTIVEERENDGGIRRRCKICRTAQVLLQQEKKREGRFSRKTHCKRGHAWADGDFVLVNDRNGIPYKACKACKRADVRANHKKRRYKLTNEEWEVKFNKQGRCCEICKSPIAGGRGWATDHDHACCPGGTSCGKCVRGILCGRHNLMLGHVRDSIVELQASIDYLIKYKKELENEHYTSPHINPE